MRRFFALAAALGMILGAMAIRPAAATHTLDNVVAQVNGGVNLDVNGNGVIDDEPCTVANGPGTGDDETGDAAQFTDVVINGTFIAGTTGLAGAAGSTEVDTVNVCVVDDASTPPVGPIPPVPTDGHGELAAANFRTPSDTTATNPATGGDSCLFGSLTGGTFTNQAVATSRAIITAVYQVHAPNSNGECDALDKGVQLAASGTVTMEADVAVAPAGQVTQGELPDLVAAQVHTIHA